MPRWEESVEVLLRPRVKGRRYAIFDIDDEEDEPKKSPRQRPAPIAGQPQRREAPTKDTRRNPMTLKTTTLKIPTTPKTDTLPRKLMDTLSRPNSC